MFLQLATARSAKKEHDVGTGRKPEGAVALGEWFGAISFQSTIDAEHVA